MPSFSSQIMRIAKQIREISNDIDSHSGELVTISERMRSCRTNPNVLATEFRPAMQNVGKAWYEATRRFPPYNFHPERCEDWNLETGGNTDLGEPLVAPWSGIVLSAHDWGGGIGRVIQILGIEPDGTLIVWAGWHLHEMHVSAGMHVSIGDLVGSIGSADGRYAGAHLHEQICVVNRWGVPSPTTFASDGRYDWRQPSAFYVDRGVDQALIDRLTEYDGA